jgi:hypothetical protein
VILCASFRRGSSFVACAQKTSEGSGPSVGGQHPKQGYAGKKAHDLGKNILIVLRELCSCLEEHPGHLHRPTLLIVVVGHPASGRIAACTSPLCPLCECTTGCQNSARAKKHTCTWHKVKKYGQRRVQRSCFVRR